MKCSLSYLIKATSSRNMMSDSCVISSDGIYRDCKPCRGSISLERIFFLRHGNRSRPGLTIHAPSPVNQSPSSISTMVKASPLRRLRPHPIPHRPGQTLTPLHFRNSMFLNPFFHSPDIAAFMPSIEICKRVRGLLDPVVRDYAYVGVAHDVLAEHFHAVFCS